MLFFSHENDPIGNPVSGRPVIRASLDLFVRQMEFVGGGQIVGFRFIDEQAAAAGLPQGSDKPVDPLVPRATGGSERAVAMDSGLVCRISRYAGR